MAISIRPSLENYLPDPNRLEKIQFKSLVVYKSHHNLTLTEALAHYNPSGFKKLKIYSRKLRCSTDHALTLWLCKRSRQPRCPFCNEHLLRRLGSTKLGGSCDSRKCIKQLEDLRSISTRQANLKNNVRNLIKKSLETGSFSSLSSYGAPEKIIEKYIPKLHSRFVRELILWKNSRENLDSTARHFTKWARHGKFLYCGCGIGILFGAKNCLRCSTKDPVVKQKIKASCVRNNGGLGFASADIQKKAGRTMRKRYGVTYSAQSEILLKKMVDTFQSNYPGLTCPAQTEKSKASRAANYANKDWVKTYRVKYENTMYERYGPNWKIDQANLMVRSRYKYRETVLGGVKFSTIGYEHIGLQWLVDKGISPQNIRYEKLRVPYINESNSESVYIPDFVVKTNSGKIYVVEVKSTYTLGLCNNGRTLWRRFQLKARGLKPETPYLLLVCDAKKVVLATFNSRSLTRGSVIKSYEAKNIAGR